MDPIKQGRQAITTPLRRMMIFGVGSLLLFQEKTQAFVEQAMERGQEAHDQGKKMVQEMRSGKQKRPPRRAKRQLDSRINEVLERLDVPSQKDIEALHQQVDTLYKRIDELQASD